MVQLATGVLQAGLDVFRLQIRQLGQHLFGSQPIGQKVKDIDHTDAHPANAGAPATLFRVNGDAVHEAKLDAAETFSKREAGATAENSPHPTKVMNRREHRGKRPQPERS